MIIRSELVNLNDFINYVWIKVYLNHILAIVGSGISGSSCAYFLKKIFEDQIEIDVYEKSDITGGRLATLEYNGRSFETGGSIIHHSNMYMDELRKTCGKWLFDFSYIQYD